MTQYLAMFDLSGIQSFIFKTNRLKEIVGASYLVSRSLMENVRQLIGEEPEAWKTRKAIDFAELETQQGKVVYIGGGNALVLFDSKEAADRFALELKQRVFEQTGGGLRICYAGIEVDPASQRLREVDTQLRRRLDAVKAVAPQTLPAQGFSLNELDNETFEPLIYFPDGIQDVGGVKRYLPRSRYLKLSEYYAQEGTGKGQRKDEPSPLVRMFQGEDHEPRFAFHKEFKDFFTGADAKSFMAIVHIDGNTMGQRIREYNEGSLTRNSSFHEDLADMAKLSRTISCVYADALVQTVEQVYGAESRDESGELVELPFRPVVADGDDITFICRSDRAFECLAAFVRALNNPAAGYDKDVIDPAKLSVGCGIAFVKQTYPFSTGYDMAEWLCSSAKKAALKRYGSGLDYPLSSVDFHVCSGELTTDIGAHRQQRFVVDGRQLLKRPYHLRLEENGLDSFFSMEGLAQRVNQVVGCADGSDCGEGGALVARSKLKGLRDAYEESANAAEDYGKKIIAREIAVRGGTADEEQLARSFEQVYEEHEDQLYAVYMDAFDVADLCGSGVTLTREEAQHD